MELVLLTPLLVGLLFFVVLCGRESQTAIQISDAAHQAARAASLAPTPQDAATAAEQVAQAALQPGSAGCAAPSVAVDTSDFQPGGSVTVTVACTVPMGDLIGLALPASRTFNQSFTAPIDTYRSTSLGFAKPDGTLDRRRAEPAGGPA